MKIILSIMTGITFLIGGELEIGSAMPLMDHQLADISGNTMTLADVKGDAGTLVVFSCNTCPWVIRWEDRYVSLANTYDDKLVYLGAIDDNAKNAKKVEVPFLANAIDALLAGNPINPQTTKALGCSIKFK